MRFKNTSDWAHTAGAQMGRTNSPKMLLLILQNLSFNYFNCLNEIETIFEAGQKRKTGQTLFSSQHLSLLPTTSHRHTTTAKFKQENTSVTERRCKAHDKMHFKNKSERARTRGALLWKTKNKFTQNATTNDHTKLISF